MQEEKSSYSWQFSIRSLAYVTALVAMACSGYSTIGVISFLFAIPIVLLGILLIITRWSITIYAVAGFFSLAIPYVTMMLYNGDPREASPGVLMFGASFFGSLGGLVGGGIGAVKKGYDLSGTLSILIGVSTLLYLFVGPGAQ